MAKLNDNDVVDIAELEQRLDQANLRVHPEKNANAIRASLKQFGAARSVVVDGDGIVRAGNGTVEQAKAAGIEKARIVKTTGDELVVVVRDDLTGTEAVAYGIADNRIGETSEWDEEALSRTLAEVDKEGLMEVTGFSFEDADALSRALESNEPEMVVADPLPPPSDPITQAGDMWHLGDHRILCGDCRSADDVARLMAGSQINVAITSPPYASQRKYDESSGFKPIHPDEYVEWFGDVQKNVAANLAEDGSWFVNIKEHCDDGQRVLYVKDLTLAHVREWEWNFVDEFCWTHGGTPKAVVNRFKNGWEPIFQFTLGRHKMLPESVMSEAGSTELGFKKNGQIGKSGHPSDQAKQGHKFRPASVMHASGDAPDWSGLHPNAEEVQQHGTTKVMALKGVDVRKKKQSSSNAALQGSSGGGREIHDAVNTNTDGMAYPSNSLSFGKNREALGHAAAFPLSLPTFFVKAYSDQNDAIYDPFMGSGTTLMACELHGRTGYGMEISPAYCDIIVRRWEASTDEKADRHPK